MLLDTGGRVLNFNQAEALRKSSEIDPHILEFATANPQPPVDWNDYGTMRMMMSGLSKQTLDMIGPPEAAIIEEYKKIPMRDGFENTIKIHRPAQPPATGSPLIVSYFGGGWISGDIDVMTPAARAYVRLFGATVVSANYRLAPEHKFPTASNDSWDSLKWVDEHASELGADPKQGFIVNGVSAGGTNTAVVATLAIENKLQNPLTGQFLCIPSIMDKEHVPEKFKEYFISHEQNKDAPVLPAEALSILADFTSWDSQSPLRYPILSKAPLSEQPRAYIQVDGMDPLRDEALIWDEMLKEAGVQTKLDFYPGCPHGHWAFFPGIEPSNKCIADSMIGVGWLLGKEITAEQGLGAMIPQAA